VRELKRERAQLVRGGGGDVATKFAAPPAALQARNEGAAGDMSLQDMFTGLNRCCAAAAAAAYR
jgi:hypothetical protein